MRKSARCPVPEASDIRFLSARIGCQTEVVVNKKLIIRDLGLAVLVRNHVISNFLKANQATSLNGPTADALPY